MAPTQRKNKGKKPQNSSVKDKKHDEEAEEEQDDDEEEEVGVNLTGQMPYWKGI